MTAVKPGRVARTTRRPSVTTRAGRGRARLRPWTRSRRSSPSSSRWNARRRSPAPPPPDARSRRRRPRRVVVGQTASMRHRGGVGALVVSAERRPFRPASRGRRSRPLPATRTRPRARIDGAAERRRRAPGRGRVRRRDAERSRSAHRRRLPPARSSSDARLERSDERIRGRDTCLRVAWPSPGGRSRRSGETSGRQPAHARHRIVHVPHRGCDELSPGVWQLPGQELVQEDAERVLVGAARRPAAPLPASGAR